MDTTKIIKFLKNKNTVTALASIIIVLVLVLGYNMRINSVTTPVPVPYASMTIQPGTKITENMIDYISVPSAAIKGKIVKNKRGIVDRYAAGNVMIPIGSFFYESALANEASNADKELYEKIGEGEVLNYITVNMISSYSNSIVPGNYVDIYASVQVLDEGKSGALKNKVAKLFENVKIVDVRTSDGKSVFASSEEARTPAVIYFGLPKEYDTILNMVHAINSWGGGETEQGEKLTTTDIKLTPIPTIAGFDKKDEDTLEVKITSPKLVSIIKERAIDWTSEKDKTEENKDDANNKKDEQ